MARNAAKNVDNARDYIPVPTDKLKEVFDGSHLETRNNVGEYKKGRDFLKHLLEPISNQDSVKDVPLLIFKKWCRKYI